MKNLQVGNIKLKVATGLKDISVTRYKDIQTLYLALMPSTDTPVETLQKAIDYINKNSIVNASTVLANYLHFIQVAEDINIWGSIFCLITFEDGEKNETLENHEVKIKLSKLEKEGLKFSTVKKEVENFMKAFPAIKRVYDIAVRIEKK